MTKSPLSHHEVSIVSQVPDPVYILHPESKRYEPLDPQVISQLQQGRSKLLELPVLSPTMVEFGTSSLDGGCLSGNRSDCRNDM